MTEGTYDPEQQHPDPAVQALIDDGWLGDWTDPVTVADLEHAVALVRKADGNDG
jgi:primase-polymerase (primpol)-like protein